jgi:hypothetical protein
VRHQDLAQQVVSAQRLRAFPKHEQDARRADALAGVKFQVNRLLTRAGFERALRRTDETRFPLSRPANGQRRAAVRPGQIEERHDAVGRPPADGREDQTFLLLRR